MMESEILTYASPHDPWWRRWAMHAIEDLSGRRQLLPIYRAWRTEVAGKDPRMMNELLGMIGTRLEINAGNPDPAPWPIAVPLEMPLVIVANHPFGIGDGIAILALAEQLGRPCRILAHSGRASRSSCSRGAGLLRQIIPPARQRNCRGRPSPPG
jgi:putative hemolysin